MLKKKNVDNNWDLLDPTKNLIIVGIDKEVQIASKNEEQNINDKILQASQESSYSIKKLLGRLLASNTSSLL